MLVVYNFLILGTGALLHFLMLFSKKLQLFVKGRQETMGILKQKIGLTDKTIWFHAASLGEYEQGIPVIEAIKKEYPNHKIVLSFFSPSGYEVKKNNTLATATVYLPLDRVKNVTAFLDAVHPEMVFFIKYEFWPNYLRALAQKKIPTFLISGIFRPNQIFFKFYGGFYRKALSAFTHFFVQNTASEHLLKSIGFTNVTRTGDTRFDRVLQILERDNHLDFMPHFKADRPLVVIGSSWPIDEDYLVAYINQYQGRAKFLFAPHNIKPEQIDLLFRKLEKQTILFSDINEKNLAAYDVLIVNTIGILTKIYSYADIAYVGGGFEKGIHNILEPATFGIPIVIGPKFKKFDEAKALTQIKGCLVAEHKQDVKIILDKLLNNVPFRLQTGNIAGDFVKSNKDATLKIMNYINSTR